MANFPNISVPYNSHVTIDPGYKLGDKIKIKLNHSNVYTRSLFNDKIEFEGIVVAVVNVAESYDRHYLVTIESKPNKKFGEICEIDKFTNMYKRNKNDENIKFATNTTPSATCIWVNKIEVGYKISDQQSFTPPANKDGTTCAICNKYDNWADVNTKSGHFVCYNCRTTRQYLFRKHGIIM